MKPKKKMVIAVIVFVLLLGAIPLFTAIANTQITITVNGQPVNFHGQPPIRLHNRTFVPVGCVFGHMGFAVSWSPATQTASMISGSIVIAAYANADFFLVNGTRIYPAVPQTVVNNNLMMTIEAVAQAVGGTSGWDAARHIGVITAPGFGHHFVYMPVVTPPPSDQIIAIPPGYNHIVTPPPYGSDHIIAIPPPYLGFGGDQIITIPPGHSPIPWWPTTPAPTPVPTPWPYITPTPWQPTPTPQPDVPPYPTYSPAPTPTPVPTPTPTPTPVPTPVPTPTPAPTPTPPPRVPIPARRMTAYELSAWIVNYHVVGGVHPYELEVVRLVNIERVNYGLQPLTINPTLMMASRFKSQEMHDLYYFAHQSPVYGHFANIARQLFDFPQATMGENLGTGQRTPEYLVAMLMRSPGHRSNILHPSFTEIGVGFYNRYWTQKFSGTSGIANNPAPER